MPSESQQQHPNLGPYRTPESQDAAKPQTLKWLIIGVAALGVICVVLMIGSGGGGSSERPSLEEIPKDLLGGVESFPAPEVELRPATPLAPLLVSDQPASLAVLSPRDGATRLRRGETLRVRFNRPMVEGRQTDRDLEQLPITFTPPIAGTAQWSSRSTLVFRPAAGAWTTDTTESQLHFAEGLASLNGEPLNDEDERVIVLDGAPRVQGYRSQGRVNAGSPLPLFFDAPVDTGTLAKELLAYEIGGGQRSLPFAVQSRGEDQEGDYRFDISLRKNLEPGARIALAITPRFLTWGGSRPGVYEYELTPRPQIEGIDCPEGAYSAEACSYTESPGHIIDIGPTLGLLSSAPLADPPDLGQIKITPTLAKMQVELTTEGYSKARRFTIRGEWEPDQAYEVRVGALRTANGETLRPLAPIAVRAAGSSPEVRVKTGQLTYESDAEPRIRFAAINHEKGQVLYRGVEAGSELDAALASRDYLGPGAKALALGPLAPRARPNRWGTGELLWRDGEERSAQMAVLAFWPSTEQPRTTASIAFVQATDLGITLRASQRDLLVWVTSMSRGEPVSGASITVQNDGRQEVGRGRTDGDGLAMIQLTGGSPLARTHAILVTAGDDRAVLRLDPRQAVAPYGMGMTPGEQAQLASTLPVASIFADRGAYRPGETLRAKVTLRQVADDRATPVRDTTFVVKLFSPSDTMPVGTATVQTNRWGTGDVEFSLSRSGALGEYTLEVYQETGQTSLGNTTVEVAQFRQPTFRVDLEVPEGALYEGDSIAFATSATYLFGAPVGAGELEWSLTRRGVASYPERWREYRFSAVDTSTPSGTITSGEGRLDASGRAQMEAQVSLGVARRGQVQIESEVTDSAGQTYAARQALTVYPAEYEVGLRDGDDWVSLGDEVDLEAILIDHQGELVEGQAVAARFVREGWHSWWEWSEGAHDEEALDEEGEGYRLRRNRRAEEVHSCDLQSWAADSIHCRHAPTRSGTYLLEVSFRDSQGRQSVASRRVYVAGPEEHPDRDAPGSIIEVTPTRASWSVGEEAELAFESPWPGTQALITVEREGVIHSERREVGAGGQVIRVPITAQMVPNVYVGVTLVRPRSAEPTEEVDLGAPDLRFGVAELRVQPATSGLEVEVEAASAEALSGTSVPVTVTVTDSQGRPVQAEVALWAVDEGTLRLTSYQAPNPTSGIFRRRAAAFAWEDLRRDLVSRIEPPPLPLSGGDGRGESDEDLPPEGEEFEPCPLWEPHLQTDAQGRVQASFSLPHRETEYRIMAVVLDEGVRWGRDSTQLVATQPVVLRAAFPRFVRAGDQFEASVFVHNTTDEAISVRLTPQIDGEARAGHTVAVEPGAEARVIELVTAPDEGSLELIFGAEAEGYTDEVIQQIPIRPAGRFVRGQALGGAEPSDSLSILFPDDTQRTAGQVTLTVAAHPFLGFEGAIAALEDSYWGGSEALAATVLAMAAYAELGLEGRPGAMSPGELRARGERVVNQLLTLQNYEGGFGSWRAGESSRPRITAFVLHALQRAQAAQIPVPEAAISRCREQLTRMARGSYFGDDYSRNDADSLAFALRVLADGEAAQTERAGAQYEQRERLSPFGMAQLAMALGDDPRADTLITRATELVLTDRDDEQRDPSRLRWYDHSAELYGAMLEASCRSEVGRRNASELARRLLAQRQPGRLYPWSTTLETAHALSALSAYARLFQMPESVQPTVVLDGRALTAAGQSSDAWWYELPFGQLLDGRRQLTIGSGDDGPVFYSIDGRWVVPLGEADRVARGNRVALHRTFETAEGTPIEDGAEVPLGTMVRVRLFVYSESSSPPMLALRDALGAGFESVDGGLDTTPRQSLEALFGMGPDDEVVDPRGHIAMRSYNNITHRRFDTEATTFYLSQLRYGLNELTYAVRATTVGDFTLPPAQIEALYDPEFIGRSSAARLRVVANRQPAEALSEAQPEGDGEVTGGDAADSDEEPEAPAEPPSDQPAEPLPVRAAARRPSGVEEPEESGEPALPAPTDQQ